MFVTIKCCFVFSSAAVDFELILADFTGKILNRNSRK